MGETKEMVVLQKIVKLSDGMEEWAEGVVIDSEEKNAEITDKLTLVKKAIRDGKAELKYMLEDFENGMKKIKDRYDVPLVPLENVKGILNTKQIDFARAKLVKEREEQAEKDRVEAERLADIEKQKKKLEAKGIKTSMPVMQEEEPVEEKKAVKSEGMYSSSSVKFIKKVKLIDITKVDPRYLLLNESLANKDLKDEVVSEVSGCEIIEVGSNTSRGA